MEDVLKWRSIIRKGGSVVDFTGMDRITVILAFILAFVFACSSGNLRMKAPEEAELTMAKAIRQKLPHRKR